jgi:hypothetical protein
MADGSAITVSASGKKSAIKDPDALLDFPFEWADWLTDIGDTYSTHEFLTVDPDDATTPLVVENSDHLSGVITAFVSGGTLGKTHELTCRITTVGGRIDDRTLFLKIKAR